MLDQHERGEAFEHRHLNLLPLAGSELVDERREDRLRPELPRDLVGDERGEIARAGVAIDAGEQAGRPARGLNDVVIGLEVRIGAALPEAGAVDIDDVGLDRFAAVIVEAEPQIGRAQEHTSELQSLMRISYAVFCLKNKKDTKLPYTKRIE